MKAISKWVIQLLLKQASIKRYIEGQLLASHPILGNPQIRFAPPGHFYSPLPDLSTLDSTHYSSTTSSGDGVNLNSEYQLQLLDKLAEVASAFDWPKEQRSERRFYLNNGYFSYGDSVVLFSFLRHFRPRKVIEVGSGFSSALMLDTNERFCNSSIQFVFIEPYPERLHQLLRPSDTATSSIITKPVQCVPLKEFDLKAGDFLFIDSSHVSKFGSDVNYLLFSVLPSLQPGVIIHFHDIFFPYEYPLEWIKGGRAWNELYVLRAFLQYNNAYELLMFNNYVGSQYPDATKRFNPLMGERAGGSIWLRKISNGR